MAVEVFCEAVLDPVVEQHRHGPDWHSEAHQHSKCSLAMEILYLENKWKCSKRKRSTLN